MAVRILDYLVLVLVLLALQPASTALLSVSDINTHYPKPISDLKEAIVKAMGFQSEDFKISGFDLRDATVGHSIAYEFDLEIDDKVVPFKLLEDVKRWDPVDLPIFRGQEPNKSGDETVLAQRGNSDDKSTVLPPIQVAGPMELWIQDAQDMRVSLPHDVDAGVLKKVILADGAVVTVKGARSVTLRHPLDLSLPLNASGKGFASGLLAMAEQLHRSSLVAGSALLSLRVVGPTSLSAAASTASSHASPATKLKLKRLAPGLVELSSPSPTDGITSLTLSATHLTPNGFTTLWPLTSIKGSSSTLVSFETLLSTILGPKADEEGVFRLVKAHVSAHTYLKIGFEVERKVEEGELEGFPEWRTKPEAVRMNYEVVARIDGEKIVPEKVKLVQQLMVEDIVSADVLLGNITMSKTPIVYAPSNPLTL